MSNHVACELMIYLLLVLLLLLNLFFATIFLIPFIPCFVWVMTQLLLTNLQVIQEILQTFQFTYKLLMTIILFLCFCALKPPKDSLMSTAAHFMHGIFLCLNIIAWSLSDGWQIGHRSKIFFGLWLIADLLIMYFKLYFIDIKDDLQINPFGFLNNTNENYDVSVRNMGLSSATNLLLFLIVQILRYIKRPHEYHLVPQHVGLVWKDNRQKEDSNGSDEKNSDMVQSRESSIEMR